MKEVQRSEIRLGREAKMGTLMGLFAAGRGVGAVLSGPISEVLLDKKRAWGDGNGDGDELFAYGTKYRVLIVFTGVSALCGLIAFGAGKAKGELVSLHDALEMRSENCEGGVC